MDYIRNRNRPRILSLIAVAVLMILGLITLGLARTASLNAHEKTVEKYRWDTEQISDRVQSTLNSYSNILYSGRALVLSSHTVEPSEWNGFFRNQDIFNRYPGMSAVSYFQIVPAAQKAAFETKMKNLYGPSFAINPAGSRDVYVVASLSASSTNMAMTGFDVYSTADRRAVYDSAKASGQPTASGQFKLSTGSEGMFAALPLARNGNTEGYIVIALHSKEFFESTIQPSKLSSFAVKVTDVTDSNSPKELYTSGNWIEGSKNLRKADVISFGGRTWSIDYQAPLNYNQSNVDAALPYLIMILGFLLVCVIALCFYIFIRMPSHPDRAVSKDSATTKE